MIRRSPVYRLVALGTVALLAGTGCGATVEPEASTAEPVTVTNCGKQVTYDRVPERAVVYDIGMTEMMFSLGLAPHMRGWVINKIYGGIDDSPYRADFAKVERLGDSRINLEIVLNAKADWVFAGHNHGFVESRGITPAILAKNGIASYLLTETCAKADENPTAVVPPVEALYTDLRNLGRIFRVSDRAEEIVADTQRRFDAAGAGKPATPARVLVTDVYEDKPYVAGRASISTTIVEKAGGRSVTSDVQNTWASVGWETVVAADPEVIVVTDYEIPFAQKKALLMNAPQMKNVTAVRKGQIYPIDFAAAMAGPRVGTAAEELATYLRSIGR
ncbi:MULTISPECIES: ABC transporter substrate-binding protein [Micromonospora]|uniref:Iron complex transport system substrate-binding protein n=1 Tax=Micromonospora yangpuensis TaxID=683228 RepID=A0A1C6UKU1_9ACTN|nr:ABC transporter substrate-binding protein [Micromonospora yangpuensis]GGM17218.1 iron transporter [Micromonospora yangpuensis]SCL54598.1 iron complex transport system substrate-binding protein [Micromonospora yangpuensis]